MALLFNRNIKAELTFGDSSSPKITELSISGANLHIGFDIEKDDTQESNICELKAYNLSDSHRSAFQLKSLGFSTGIVYAGHGDSLTPLYSGDIAEIKDVVEGADICTIFTLCTGFNAKQAQENSMSWGKETKLTEVVECVSDVDVDWRTSVANSFQYPRGLVLSGNPKDFVFRVVKDAGLKATEDDGVLKVEQASANPIISLTVVSSETGMIGIPEQITRQLDNQDSDVDEQVSSDQEPGQYDEIIQRASAKYNVDPDLIKSMMRVESANNPNAVSSKGASGLMQLMPETAKEEGVTDIHDPEQNIMAGTSYMSKMLKRYNGNSTLAVAAYNAGAGNVDKYKGVPPFKETQNYVNQVLGKNPTKATIGYRSTMLLNPRMAPMDHIELNSSRLRIKNLQLKVGKVRHVGSNYSEEFYTIVDAFYEDVGSKTTPTDNGTVESRYDESISNIGRV